jgi:murein DD-endopeptidase MepM/ murein hydrolase activator NlpD
MTCCDNATAWRGGNGASHPLREKRLFLLLCGILSILAPTTAVAVPNIEFSPVTGSWTYTPSGPAAGMFNFSQTITVNRVGGDTIDPLVGVGFVHIPDLTLSGSVGGPYILTPIGSATITIRDSTGTIIYLAGTLALDRILPIGTNAVAYPGVFVVDITNITINNTIGSAILDVFIGNGLADFKLSLQFDADFQAMLDNGLKGNDGFSGVITVIPASFSGAGSGTEQDPYIITDVNQLQEMKDGLYSWYELGNDIDAFATRDWNGGKGFIPIGKLDAFERFRGHFDGKGHTISGLYINRPTSYVGLFGLTYADNEIKNVGLIDADITGSQYVGALIGTNGFYEVSNCYSTGIVNSVESPWGIGGLVGQLNYLGSITNCYSQAIVNGCRYTTGGFLGTGESGTVTNCYSTGLVNNGIAGDRVGGFVGYWYSDEVAYENCFWDIETSGQDTSFGGTGKTTAEMKQKATFTNWDFDTVWDIIEGVTYPYLRDVPPPSEQPVLKAPWAGMAKISQGNRGWKSHNTCYNRELEPRDCNWENTYAIDVNLPVGSDVLAPAEGVIFDIVNKPNSGGKELIIQHTVPTGKKFYTVYLHLDKILVEKNKPVTQGWVVAKSGDTGIVTGPHLHFHLWSEIGSYDSHTIPIERLVLKQVGVDNDFREYDARKGELDNVNIAGKDFESNNIPIRHDLRIIFYLCSPADMVITDPDGLIISKELNQISDASYEEIDVDGDDDLEDKVIIYHRKVGEYLIQVVPESNAVPTDTYSLKAIVDEQTMVLAQDVQIQDIPAEPYIFESKLNRCDFDSDGDVDVVDLDTFVQHWLAEDCNYPSWCEGTDLNYSGHVNFVDFAIFAENWLWEKIPADIDIDGDVDFEDYAAFANHWLNQNCAEPNWCSGADLDKSGSVDLYDLGKFAEYWLEGL